MLAETELHPGGRPSKTGATVEPVSLRDLGVSKKESSRWQREAAIPADEFERFVAEVSDAGDEVTSAGLLRLAKARETALWLAELRARGEGVDTAFCRASDLSALIDAGYRFGTIYADPPWEYGNRATRASAEKNYSTESVAGMIEKLPVADLAAPESHLHLWTTNAFLFEAKALMEAWGFEYKSCFVWVKPKIGIGNYWRVSHEFMLLGVRGGLTFMDLSLRSWFECDRGKHSRKPEQVRKLIQLSSPGPRLEMFARESVKDWVCWGNEVERGMFDASVREIRSDAAVDAEDPSQLVISGGIG